MTRKRKEILSGLDGWNGESIYAKISRYKMFYKDLYVIQVQTSEKHVDLHLYSEKDGYLGTTNTYHYACKGNTQVFDVPYQKDVPTLEFYKNKKAFLKVHVRDVTKRDLTEIFQKLQDDCRKMRYQNQILDQAIEDSKIPKGFTKDSRPDIHIKADSIRTEKWYGDFFVNYNGKYMTIPAIGEINKERFGYTFSFWFPTLKNVSYKDVRVIAWKPNPAIIDNNTI